MGLYWVPCPFDCMQHILLSLVPVWLITLLRGKQDGEPSSDMNPNRKGLVMPEYGLTKSEAGSIFQHPLYNNNNNTFSSHRMIVVVLYLKPGFAAMNNVYRLIKKRIHVLCYNEWMKSNSHAGAEAMLPVRRLSFWMKPPWLWDGFDWMVMWFWLRMECSFNLAITTHFTL